MNILLLNAVLLLLFHLKLIYAFHYFPNQRIVGGQNMSIEKVPYQVSLQKNGEHSCGGSIISPYQIVSAAHCVHGLDPSGLSIRAGTSILGDGGQVVSVHQFFIHPKYDSFTANYDISVLELSSNLTFGFTIAAIRLPEYNQTWLAGTEVLVTGWGLKNEYSSALSFTLQGVNVEIVDQETCNVAYDGDISDYMLCAGVAGGGKDACSDDSGGPLQVNGILAGVVSWGNGCGRDGYPGVYSNVAILKNFITEVTVL